MTPEEFRRRGHELIDWIADFRASVYAGELPALSQVPPGMVAPPLAVFAAATAESFDAILRDLDQHIVPALSHFQHPVVLRLLSRRTACSLRCSATT